MVIKTQKKQIKISNAPANVNILIMLVDADIIVPNDCDDADD